MMIAKFKFFQRLGAVPPDPHTWGLLIGIGTPPENFLPTPLRDIHMHKFHMAK